MKSECGFAVATTLLVLVVVAALSASAVFAAVMNLRIAENARSALLAQTAAEAGLDLALVGIAQLHHQHGELPSLPTLQAYLPESGDHDVTELAISGDTGVVRVTGIGPGGARHPTGARFRITSVPGSPAMSPFPLYAVGLVSVGSIYLPGQGIYDLNLHSGGTIIADGGGSQLAAGRVAAAAGATCSFHDTECATFAPTPTVPPYDFDAAYASLRASAPDCTRTITSSGQVNGAVNAVICLEGAVTVTLRGTLTNTFIFGPPEASIVYRATSMPATAGGMGIKVAVGHVDMSYNDGVLNGENTVFTRRGLLIRKTATANAGDQILNVFASESDIRLDGGGNGRVVGSFRTNGRFCVLGTLSTFVGSVVAGFDVVPEPLCTVATSGFSGLGSDVGIQFDGSIDLAFTPAAEAFLNDDLTAIGEGAPIDATGIEILSRRP